MTIDGLLWTALEGGLGHRKTAYLRYAPLSEIVGVSTLPDAVAVHGASVHDKKAFYQSLQSSFEALAQVLPPQEKTAMPYPVNTSFARKVAVAQKVRILERASEGEVTEKAGAIRRAVDIDVFDQFVKQANILAGVPDSPPARELGKRLKHRDDSTPPTVSALEPDAGLGKAAGLGGDLGKKLLGGAAFGTAMGVPLYLGGTALAEENAEQMRNKALQAALGAGVIGVGAYGAGRGIDYAATEKERDNQAARSVDMQRAMLANTLAAQQAMNYRKYSAHAKAADCKTDLTEPSSVLEDSKGEHWPSKTKEKAPGGEVKLEQHEDKVARLMTTVYIDSFLSQVDQTEKVAEIREVNRDYGVTLLCALEKGATGKQAGDAAQAAIAKAQAKKDPKRRAAETDAAMQGAGHAYHVSSEYTPITGKETQLGAILRSGRENQRAARKTTSGPGGTTLQKRKEGPGGATQ